LLVVIKLLFLFAFVKYMEMILYSWYLQDCNFTTDALSLLSFDVNIFVLISLIFSIFTDTCFAGKHAKSKC